MTRPNVFISHSTHDHGCLTHLVEGLRRVTGGSIDFFLAGVDVAPGSDWPVEIRSALDKAGLVLVFVSPSAQDSRWVYYEAGYANARQLPIVPIGIRGVEVGNLPAPLGLKQGFDLVAPDDLTRVIDCLNRTFKHAHEVTAADLANGGRLSRAEILELFTHRVPRKRQASSGTYRVLRPRLGRPILPEHLEISVNGDRMEVRSIEQHWTSRGDLSDDRYFGRFKYDRGNEPKDRGAHDMRWDGEQFIGSVRFDNGRWLAEDLVWRPDPTGGERAK